MCVLLGLGLALFGAASIGDALAAIDRRFFHVWQYSGWSGFLVSEKRIWGNWSVGAVFLLFGGLLGTIGVRELIRRFRMQNSKHETN